MMKIFIALMISVGISANIEVKQNIRALYKNINLTAEQEDYILDNQEIMQNITQKTLIKISKIDLKNKNIINEKNVIEFLLHPNGKMTKFRFLLRSDDRAIDKLTKKTILNIFNQYPKPNKITPIRYIFIYKKGNMQNKNSSIKNTKKRNVMERIYRGTTYFKHSNKEQRRYFITENDGFVYMEILTASCHKKITLLDENNRKIQSIHTYQKQEINLDLPKGLYKIFINTNRECKINLEYK